MGETILYFGCRKKNEDYLYQDELNEYLADGTLTKLYLAFSRDQAQKVYVTHLLQQNKEEIWQIIGEQNGHIYVCGYVVLCFYVKQNIAFYYKNN